MTKSFTCQTCGYEDTKPGMCPDCDIELEEVCSRCGNVKSECVCEVGDEEEEK